MSVAVVHSPIKNNSTNEYNLWFVNLGGYSNQSMAEQHEFGIVVARTAQSAKIQAMKASQDLKQFWGVSKSSKATGLQKLWTPSTKNKKQSALKHHILSPMHKNPHHNDQPGELHLISPAQSYPPFLLGQLQII